MGWFEEQIKERQEKDDLVLEESYLKIANAVMGQHTGTLLTSERIRVKDAIDEVLKYYRIKSVDIPDSVTGTEEQLEYCLRPYGIMKRNVHLDKGWYKDAFGVMLGARKSDGALICFAPGKFAGYTYFNTETGKREKITAKNEDQFEDAAYAFYKPFPLKELNIPELIRYVMGIFSVSDMVWYIGCLIAVTLLGMLMPQLNKILFSDVIGAGSVSVLLAMAVFMVCVTISSMLLSAVSAFISARIGTKLSMSVEAATMMRILSLPADFFKEYSAGELSSRSSYMNSLCNTIVNQILGSGFTSLFSLIYIAQIFAYAPALVVPALCITLITIIISVVSALWQMKISKKRMELAAKESGMSFALISGIQKIKLAGAEKRAFARWGNLYAEQAQLTYNPRYS